MNAPFLPHKAGRYDRLSPAQKILQAAADRAIMAEIVRDMNLKPGPSIGAICPDRLSTDAWRD